MEVERDTLSARNNNIIIIEDLIEHRHNKYN